MLRGPYVGRELNEASFLSGAFWRMASVELHAIYKKKKKQPLEVCVDSNGAISGAKAIIMGDLPLPMELEQSQMLHLSEWPIHYCWFYLSLSWQTAHHQICRMPCVSWGHRLRCPRWFPLHFKIWASVIWQRIESVTFEHVTCVKTRSVVDDPKVIFLIKISQGEGNEGYICLHVACSRHPVLRTLLG